RVLRYSGSGTGTFVDTFIAPGLGGLTTPTGIVFDGATIASDLLVADRDFNNGPGNPPGAIMRYNGTTGACLPGTAFPGSSALSATGNGLNQPLGLAILNKPTTTVLLVANSGGNNILQYDLNGTFLGVFGDASPAKSPISNPQDIFVNP